MAIDDPAARAAYQKYWGPIRESARLGLSTSDMWTLIRGASEAAGLESPGVSASAVSVVRGIAGRMQAAADRLMAAGRDIPLDASMLSVAPWSRDPATMGASPMYQVSYLSTVINDQGEQQVWRSLMLPGFPTSGADLLDLIDQAVAANEEGYTEQFVNLDSYQMVAV